jgi:hypothetical protein
MVGTGRFRVRRVVADVVFLVVVFFAEGRFSAGIGTLSRISERSNATTFRCRRGQSSEDKRLASGVNHPGS